MQRRLVLSLSACAAVLGVSIALPRPSGADDRMPLRTPAWAPRAQPAATLSAWRPRDGAFVKIAYRQAVAHMMMASEASRQASDPAVRQFALRMSREQGILHSGLQAAANREGVELPSGLDPLHRAEIKRMAKLAGAAFDAAYLDHVISCMKLDMLRYLHQSESGGDAQLRRWAAAQLPKLRIRAIAAQQLQQRVISPRSALL